MAYLYDYLDDYDCDLEDEDELNEYLSNLGLEDDEDSRIDDLEIAKSKKLRMSMLQPYDVPEAIVKIEQGQGSFGSDIAPELSKLLEFKPHFRKNEKVYTKAYTTMVQLEEASQSHFLIQFNHQNIKLTYSGEGREFLIKNEPKVSRMVEAVDDSILDWFTLKPKRARTEVSISGQVKGSNKEFMFVEIAEENFDYLKRNCDIDLYDIHFHINRVPFQLQHNALDWMVSHKLFDLLINNPKYDRFSHETEDLFNEKSYTFSGNLASKLNEEQRSAAINIIKTKNGSLPYLLFGPAGTGKTGTLVAAIEEIVRSTSNCVLVCANSNSACDEITERLLNVLNPDEIYRMYAKSFDHRKISEKIKPICNLHKKEFFFSSLKYLYHFRVLVCTLTTAGCLTRAREEKCFNSSHFSHIIIDEGASTHETVSMIPIAGLCTSRNGINSSIVLAGDPKQLDAVTKSGNAAKLGFKTSFLEHLFNRELYKRNPLTGQYNRRYITQLVKNYRSHPAILHIPNALFYENKLEAKASTDITNWYIGSKLLPSKLFPVIFKSVQGMCRKSAEDFSMFNMKEVNVVIDYVKELLQKNANQKSITQADIGIVTPYKLQTKVIARVCRKYGFNDITIGTAEVFQGQERPVMIVSTVRTGGILGFVKDPRRLNVVITRAKCLLIIVGDPHTLCLDGNWRTLIKYCVQNNAMIQSDRPFRSVFL